MKHICDEKGCRLVSDEEYERLEKEKMLSNESEKTKDKKPR